MKESESNTAWMVVKYLRNPHLWIIAFIVAVLTIVHYHEVFAGVDVIDRIGSLLGLGLTRHTLERILFILPVVYGAIVLGTGAGISLVILVAAAMLPRVLLVSAEPREALSETLGVLVTCVLLVSLQYTWNKGTQRLKKLESAQSQLNSHIRRLGMLHTISTLINQSLELNRVMDDATGRVAQTMESQVAWLYLKDEERNILRLFSGYNLPPGTMADELNPGEGPDGQAARQLGPVIIEGGMTGCEDHSLLTVLDGIKSLMVVPLISKGNAVGTLGVGFYFPHHFPPDEIDLLTAVAGQFSMAVENSRLYEKERSAAEELRVSERNYREIFESASDAIWVHDLDGKLLAVNSALCLLTGYEMGSLIGANVSIFSPDFELTRPSRESHDRVFAGEPDQPYEQRFVKKDGIETIVQISTSLITRGGIPWAFQHVARDITRERNIQDNLRVYVQKISQAQEAERKRIARELHDDTVQNLVVVSRHLYNLAAGKSDLSALDIREEVHKISDGLRHFSQELRPSILDDLGLIPAVKWLASDLTNNYQIIVETEITGKQRNLSSEIELMLFRITQESLTNVRKHSQATTVSIKIEFSEQYVKITIRDNGQGFELKPQMGDLTRSGKLGLIGMQERAQLLGGNLDVESQPGKGTSVTVLVPIKNAA